MRHNFFVCKGHFGCSSDRNTCRINKNAMKMEDGGVGWAVGIWNVGMRYSRPVLSSTGTCCFRLFYDPSLDSLLLLFLSLITRKMDATADQPSVSSGGDGGEN